MRKVSLYDKWVRKKKKKTLKKIHKNLHLKLYVTLSAFFILFLTMFALSKPSSSQIASRESLQLDYFLPSVTPTTMPPTPTSHPIIPTPTVRIPTPTPKVAYCAPDSPKHADCECPPTEWIGYVSGIHFMYANTGGCNVYLGYYAPNGPVQCTQMCIGKPIIYLYPTQDTFVNVQVQTAGQVVVSDPKIEERNTWTNVLAHPGGKFDYKGKTYSELFYETEARSLSAPQEGIIISVQNLEDKLREEITLLGLTKASEQQEFLDWWVPRLQALHAPYILFSILNASEKARLDDVEISPKPDTFIDFIAYFKPLQQVVPVDKLEITAAPKRQGFAAVEWGGVIDK